MQLALHVLNFLDSNCKQLKAFQLEDLIDEVLQDKQDLNIINNLNLNDSINTFKNLYNRFIGYGKTDKSIKKIIDNYKMLCWNDSSHHSEIILIYSNCTEITEPLKWLREKHIFHSMKKIDSGDNTVEYLKEIAEEAKISIQDFWKIPIGNDEWIKMNISSIKTPIFIKQNNVSIFSPEGTEFYEFVQIGFNKDALAEKLNVL